MARIIRICFLKQYWELANRKGNFVFSIFLNALVLTVPYFNAMSSGDFTFLGINYFVFILLYIVIWSIMNSLAQVNDIIQKEIQVGTIEQIQMASCNITTYMLANIIIKNIISILLITAVLVASSAITSLADKWQIVSFAMTLLIGNIGLAGAGLIMTTISLLVNNFKNVFFIVRTFIIWLMVISDANILIPFTYAKSILIELFIRDTYLWQMPLDSILFFLLNTLVYIVLGVLVFNSIGNKRYIQNNE